jgi:hypothetical protein
VLVASDFKPGLPVIIQGRKADITQASEVGIYAEALDPIGPTDSRFEAWAVPVVNVVKVVVYDVRRDFVENGSVLCDDCGGRVRTRTLESLPEHGCVERQARRSAPEGAGVEEEG